jgi:hypothetical protein
LRGINPNHVIANTLAFLPEYRGQPLVGSSRWIAEGLADKICDPARLLRPGFYAHPGLGLLTDPVLDAQAVFKIPQSVAPPEAKNAEIVRALFEESGQAAIRPDAVTAQLVASVDARTRSMAAIADHRGARSGSHQTDGRLRR